MGEHVDLSTDILKDLINQGYEGEKLLSKFIQIKQDLPNAIKRMAKDNVTRFSTIEELDAFLDSIDVDDLEKAQYFDDMDAYEKYIKRTPETKHNYFEIKGDIHVNKEMTVEEFSSLLANLGIEFTGQINMSVLYDKQGDLKEFVEKITEENRHDYIDLQSTWNELDDDFKQGLDYLFKYYDKTLRNLADR